MRIAQCIVYSLKWQRGIDLVWSLTDNRQAGIDGGTARELVRSLFDAKKKRNLRAARTARQYYHTGWYQLPLTCGAMHDALAIGLGAFLDALSRYQVGRLAADYIATDPQRWGRLQG